MMMLMMTTMIVVTMMRRMRYCSLGVLGPSASAPLVLECAGAYITGGARRVYPRHPLAREQAFHPL